MTSYPEERHEMDEAPGNEPAAIRPGMIYEDCAFHPCLCTAVHSDGSISGISLIDASSPRCCDPAHCGVEILTVADLVEIRRDFTRHVARRMSELGIDD